MPIVIWSLRLLKLMMNPRRAVQLIGAALCSPQRLERRLAGLRPPKAMGPIRVGPAEFALLNETLRANGIALETRRIDVRTVMDFFGRGRYSRRWFYYAAGRDRTVLQKVLEHLTAAELLDLDRADLYLDVASQDSPAPEIYRGLYGCRVLRQDLGYRAGVHMGRIGSSAAAIPLPGGSVSKIALHNAFEHFEGDADTGFIREAQRLLCVGGRLCILPLFIHPTYSIQTDLSMLPPGTEDRFEEGARIHHAPGWRDLHGRFYDVPQLIRRVIQPATHLRVRVIHYENAAELYPGCHMHYAALFERAEHAVRASEPVALDAEKVALNA